MDILPLFSDIDDFCLLFEPLWQQRLLETRQRRRASTLCLSEVMTIIVLFHASSYRNFKAYYTEQVLPHYVWAFPRLVSYGRFVELMPGRSSRSAATCRRGRGAARASRSWTRLP